MAAEYFLYTTEYNNTLVDRSDTSFAPLPPNTGEILIDYFIPEIQPLYYYRESGLTIVISDETTINDYLEGTALPPQPDDSVLQNEFTGYTASTNIEIEDIRTSYLPLTGGTISGGLKINQSLYVTGTTATTEQLENAVLLGAITTDGQIVTTNTPALNVNPEVKDISGDTFVTDISGIYYVDTTSGDVTITLPEADVSNDGKSFTILKKSPDDFNVIIEVTGQTQLIGSLLVQEIVQIEKGISIVSDKDNSKWIIIQDSRYLEGATNGELQFWDDDADRWKPTTSDITWNNVDLKLTVGGLSSPPTFQVDATNDIVYINANSITGLTAQDNLGLYAGGRGAFGNAVTIDRLRANAAGNVPRSFSLIDDNAVMRVWRYTDSGGDPAVEFIWGTEATPSTTGNAWWDMYLDGKSDGTDSFAIRRRTGGNDVNLLTVNTGGTTIEHTTSIGEKINFIEYNNSTPDAGDLWYSGNSLTFNNGNKSFDLTPLVLANPNYINVDKDGYGDFTTFYDAINSIPTGSSEQYLINFVPNTYVETNQIVIPSNVLVQFNSAILFFAGVSDDCIKYENVNRTTLNGGYLLTSTGHTNALIDIYDSNNLLFENMFFLEGNVGINIEASTGTTQALAYLNLGKFFSGMTKGIVSTNTNDLAIINFENNAKTGYELIGSENVIITGGGIRFCEIVGIESINSSLLINGLTVRNVYDSVHLHSGSTLNGSSLIIEDSVNLDIWQEDSESIIDLTNSKLNQYKLSIANWDNFAADYDNDVATERAYHYNKDVHVGTPENPRELVAGEGNSIGRETLVYTYNPISGYTNVSNLVATDSTTGTSAGFPTTEVDNAVYFSSDITTKDGDKYKFGGLKGGMSYLGAPGTGGYQYEYWNGSEWKHFNRMITDRNSPYQSYAQNFGLFQGTMPHTFQYRFDSTIFDDWTKSDPMSSGTDRYWMRIRIYAEVDASWEVYNVKVHTNRTEINGDGFIEYFGKARPVKKLELQYNSFRPAINSPGNQDLFYSKGLYAGRVENMFSPTAIDSVGYMGYLPFDIDSSSPLIFKISYIPLTNDEGFIKFKLKWGIMGVGDELFGNEGSSPISASTENTIEDYVPVSANTENKITEMRIKGVKIPDAIAQKADATSDIIVFTLYREGNDVGDTYGGGAAVIDVGVYYNAWRAGGHTEIF